MRRLPLGIALAVLGTSGAAAASDSLTGTRSGERMTERAHEIRLTIDRDGAELRVRRTVHNGGERHDQAVFLLAPPPGAVAVGLATLGIANGQPTWFRGQLMEAEEAAAKYQELTGIGGYYPKDPALLSWRSMDRLALQVFPVAPATEKTVEYTLRMPVDYAGGRYSLMLPPLGTAALPAEVEVHPARRRDQIFVDDEPRGRGATVTLDREIVIGLGRRDPAPLEGGLAVVSTGDARSLVRYRIETAARLSEIPRDARVVVLLDASRSLAEGQIEAEVAAARAYLSHFADPRLRARADVVAFDRRARPRHGALRPVADVLADLETFAPTPGNGSHVDDAFERARELLAAAGKGPRRIVLMTDTNMRDELTPARVAALARRTGALVHIATVGEGGGTLHRSDGHDWSAAANDTGGVLWSAAIDPGDPARNEALLEEWARPVRLHALALRVAGLPAVDQPSVAESLAEGEAVGDLFLTSADVRSVSLRGVLWTKPVLEVIVPSDAEARTWAALVFGTPLHAELTEPEMMVLAMHGRAVSPVTSYLAVEPGVRPSTEGLGWGRGFGFSGQGRRVPRVRHGTAMPRASLPDPETVLREHLAAALAACGSPSVEATVELETTRREIVDIDSVTARPADPVLHDCVTEQLWSVALDGEVFRDHHRAWRVSVG